MKTEKKQSVIKEWVSELPFTQQALLMLALRGADGMPKHNTAKNVVHYLRDVILHAAYPDYDGTPEGFMRADYENFGLVVKMFWGDTDAYPMHFLMHLIHAAEVVGYNHPNKTMRGQWLAFYELACKNLHMNPESKRQLNSRLAR